MDAEAKKTALRMIPYGVYILTATILRMKQRGEKIYYGG